MLRDLVSVSACLLVLALFAGCRLTGPGGGDRQPDDFEPDGEHELAKEQLVNAPPQSHTLWPAGDVDFIRFRVNEVDIDGSDGEGPLAFVDLRDMYYVDEYNVTWYYDRTPITLATMDDYRTPDGGFSVPGIYYVKVPGQATRGGSYKSLVRMLREGSGPDLVVTSVEPPDEIIEGKAVTIQVFIVNQGGEDTIDETECKIYASADRQPGPEDVLLATETVPVLVKWALGYSDWTPFTLDVTIDPFPVLSPTIPDGPVYIFAKVNGIMAGEAVGETRNNNTGLGSCLLNPASSSSAVPIEFSGGPTVSLTAQVLYPADDEATAGVNEADVHDFVLQPDAGLDYYEIWTENLVGRTDTKIELLDDSVPPLPLDPEVIAEDGGLENGASYLCYDSGGAVVPLTIRVTDENGRAGGYDLVVRASATEPDRFEPDGGTGTWRVLYPELPDEFEDRRSFSTGDEEDWVAYPVSAADHLRKHTIGTYDHYESETLLAFTTRLEIYRAGSSTVVAENEAAGGAVLADLVLDAGLYYVKVTAPGGTAGSTYWLRADSPTD